MDGASSSSSSSGGAVMPAVPRVNGAMLSSYEGKLVTLVGRVVSVGADSANIEAADHAIVKLSVMPESPLHSTSRPSEFVEIVGVVAADGSVREQLTAYLPTSGTPFDLDTYNEVVKLSVGKFAAIFA